MSSLLAFGFPVVLFFVMLQNYCDQIFLSLSYSQLMFIWIHGLNKIQGHFGYQSYQTCSQTYHEA